MFPFWNNSCYYGSEPLSRKSYLERRLRFLKWTRDELETRLAGINATISKVEQQLGEDEAAST
jgi:hypothetical protein